MVDNGYTQNDFLYDRIDERLMLGSHLCTRCASNFHAVSGGNAGKSSLHLPKNAAAGNSRNNIPPGEFPAPKTA